MIEGVGAMRNFGASDQENFARLSGDWNPMHMDVLAARRTQAGSRVVHGVHLFLWALDHLACSGGRINLLTSAKIKFTAFVHLERPVVLAIAKTGSEGVRLQLMAGEAPALIAKLRFSESGDIASVPIFSDGAPKISVGEVALEPEFEAMGKQAGRLDLPDGATRLAETLFPALCFAVGATAVCEMALLSTVVGMIVPGLHSILSEVAISLRDDGCGLPGCDFRVIGTDVRFRRVELVTKGSRMSGSLTAFARFPSPSAPTFEAASAFVVPGEFRGRRSLIIGGSRGIGAATAKLIAAGGGTVALSYVEGRAEAETVAQDINLGCGSSNCTIFRYDAEANPEPQLASVPFAVTHVYYFATPHIFGQGKVAYSAERFLEFAKIYVDGFYNLVMALVNSQTPSGLALFYPSSIAVVERPRYMSEYSMAKAAGEILCADLLRTIPGISIAMPRLPRIETDQTATVPPVAAASALEVMLPLLRCQQSANQAATTDSLNAQPV
jgi:hypothetical protein